MPSFPGVVWTCSPMNSRILMASSSFYPYLSRRCLPRPLVVAQSQSCIPKVTIDSNGLCALHWTAKQAILVRNGICHPPDVEWSHWETPTLWSGARPCPPLESLPHVPIRLVDSKGPPKSISQLSGSAMALPSCRMVALGDTDPLERR